MAASSGVKSGVKKSAKGKPPRLLPWPKKLNPGGGRLAVSSQVPLVLSPSCGEEEFFAADLLREEIGSRSGVELVIEKHAKPEGLKKALLFLRLEDAKRPAGKGYFPAPKGAGGAGQTGEEGYLLEISERGLTLAARTAAGIYYGVQTVRQLLDPQGGRMFLPALKATDWPDFRYRGLMHDVSRGKVPKLRTLFELVELLGSLKMNVLQLYTEHTFAFRRHPEISRSSGALTAEEVIKLEEHARRHHVELQANLQSFGHAARILSLRRYKGLAESERAWTLAPGEKGTLDLLDDLYAEVLPCFRARLFNADCDETWDLGEGKSKKACERLGKGRVYLDHIKNLRKLAAGYGKRLAIWGDIVLKHPETIPRIPKDIVMLNWGYGADHDFASARRFKRAGLEHWVCPGTNSWGSLFPRIEVACRNIAGFAREGVKTGATGLLNTDWGDGGHPNLLGQSFHGIAFGGEAAWSGPAGDDADFDARFSWAVARDRSGLLGKIWRTLGRTNEAFGELRSDSVPFWMYWAEFPDDEVLKSVSLRAVGKCEGVAMRAQSMLMLARKTLPGRKLLIDELELANRQTLLACAKARLAASVRRARRQAGAPEPQPGDPAMGFGGQALPEELLVPVQALLREWKLQRDEFERLWHVRSKRSEIEIRLRLYRIREQELARLATPQTPDEGWEP